MSATSIILLVIVLVAILVVVAAWLYERASRELSLVRTGLGGQEQLRTELEPMAARMAVGFFCV